MGDAAGVAQILMILRDRFAADAIGGVCRDVVKFRYFERADQHMDTYSLEFDIPRQKGEARMLMGSGFPDEFVSVLCMKNASPSKKEKTLALVSLQNTLAFPAVSAQMRRLFGPCGYASRQDVLVAAKMDTGSEEEDFEAWTAYRKAKRAKKDGTSGGSRGAQKKRKPSEDVRSKNGLSIELVSTTSAVPAIVITTMRRSVHRRKIVAAALRRPCDR